MKRFIIGLAAFSMLTPVAAMAQGYQGHATVQQINSKVIIKKKVVRDHGNRHHHWARGRDLPREYRSNIIVYSKYHLKRPGANRVWVRTGDQFLLINRNTGRIIETATPQ